MSVPVKSQHLHGSPLERPHCHIL